MKKVHIFTCKAICFLLVFIISYSAYAQPAWSRGIQTLTVTHEEGMKRAKGALEAEGYAINYTGGDFIAAFKGLNTALITCNATTDGKAYINIFVASTSNDGNVPGAERVRLQAQMDKPNSFTTTNSRQGNWDTQANSLGGNVGDRFTLYFPPGGTVSDRVWGTDIYTNDGSIAAAAVHAGQITHQSGGTVTIEIRPGQDSYIGTYRNGITSHNFGSFGRSFVFVGGNVPQPPPSEAIEVQATWGTRADGYRGKNGQRIIYHIPPAGTLSGIWGTDTYTDDSSVGTAAVHAGLITLQNGGTVTIEIRGGQSAYQGSIRNGVTSNGYGGWTGSFVFVR